MSHKKDDDKKNEDLLRSHVKGEDKANPESKETGRRYFLKFGLLTGVAVTTGIGISKALSGDTANKTDGKLAEPDSLFSKPDSTFVRCHSVGVTNEEARIGMRGKKFVMVFDLAKCDGCGSCTRACQEAHYISPESGVEWLKVFKMQDNEFSAPYWFPKPCFQCDNSPCVKVCPVGATFKREDGIVLVDNERCIGCRSCMAGCPYSTRHFNWFPIVNPPELANVKYSPEQGYPRKVGTVEKCDFCPHMIRQGKMPHCITACSKDAIYFGDENENAVTNGSGETVNFTELLKDNAAYRSMEELGTKPRVYYLPPKNRRFPEPTKEDVERKIKDPKKKLEQHHHEKNNSKV